MACLDIKLKKYLPENIEIRQKTNDFIINSLIFMTPGMHGKYIIFLRIWNSHNQDTSVTKFEKNLSTISASEVRPKSKCK